MRKWMDKGAAKAEEGTPAPRGVNFLRILCTIYQLISDWVIQTGV